MSFNAVVVHAVAGHGTRQRDRAGAAARRGVGERGPPGARHRRADRFGQDRSGARHRRADPASRSSSRTRDRSTAAWISAPPSLDASAQRRVPHHLIDVADPDEPFTVADWVDRARAADPRDRGTWAAAAGRRRNRPVCLGARRRPRLRRASPGLPSSGSAWRTSSRPMASSRSSRAWRQRIRPRPRRSTCATRDGCCGRSSARRPEAAEPRDPAAVRRAGRARRPRPAERGPLPTDRRACASALRRRPSRGGAAAASRGIRSRAAADERARLCRGRRATWRGSGAWTRPWRSRHVARGSTRNASSPGSVATRGSRGSRSVTGPRTPTRWWVGPRPLLRARAQLIGSPIDWRQAATPLMASARRRHRGDHRHHRLLERPRPAEVEALAGGDPETQERSDLRGALDPLGDDERARARGELDHRSDDGAGRPLRRAALDEGQVHLQHVELDLGQQPKAGVAGADVIGGEPDARRARQAVDPRSRRARGRRSGWCSVSSMTSRSGGNSWRARMASIAPLLNSDASSVDGDEVDGQELVLAAARAAPATIVSTQARSSVVSLAVRPRPRRTAASGLANGAGGIGRIRPSTPITWPSGDGHDRLVDRAELAARDHLGHRRRRGAGADRRDLHRRLVQPRPRCVRRAWPHTAPHRPARRAAPGRGRARAAPRCPPENESGSASSTRAAGCRAWVEQAPRARPGRRRDRCAAGGPRTRRRRRGRRDPPRRSAPFSRAPNPRSTRSPLAWPRVSLIDLKSSRSIEKERRAARRSEGPPRPGDRAPRGRRGGCPAR